MNLPNAASAIVERSKVVGYLLSSEHPAGRAKARFFGAFGFTLGSREILVEALRRHAAVNLVSQVDSTAFGKEFGVEGPLSCPDGRTPGLRSIWSVAEGADQPRLVTA